MQNPGLDKINKNFGHTLEKVFVVENLRIIKLIKKRPFNSIEWFLIN